MTQLQQELKAERSRHQDTVQRLQQAKKSITELQEEMEQQQNSLRELNSKVGPVFLTIVISMILYTVEPRYSAVVGVHDFGLHCK